MNPSLTFTFSLWGWVALFFAQALLAAFLAEALRRRRR